MRRLRRPGRRERGAVAVVVAIWMVVAMAFVAISVDVGSVYSDKKQLQNGADAAALAIAQNCVRGNCGDTTGTADKYVKANKLDGVGTGTLAAGTNLSSGVVVVQADSAHQNWFAGILGMATTPVSAKATAKWGYPSGGAALPLAFSWCSFWNATGGWDDKGVPNFSDPVVIHIVESACTPPAHNEVPGGFGELKGTNCLATVLAGGWIMSDTGNNGPNSCSGFDWNTVLGTTVLVPIFDNFKGTGTNAQYQIKGLAAFTFTGVCLGPQATAPSTMPSCPSDKRIEGKFTNYTSYKGNFDIDPNAAHFGVETVRLAA
jgi:hypothetical protein